MVTIRYFAAARAARGVDSESVDYQGALDGMLTDLGAAHTDRTAAGMSLAGVFDRCTFLVDGRRSGRDVVLTGHEGVDVLPPFAGG